MRSLILTVLYLAKDTVHRWLTRLSSPLARVLVVFFLSLSALCALGSYAISTKIVRDKIREQGGDLVVVTMLNTGDAPSSLPSAREISELLDADSFAVQLVATAKVGEHRSVPVYTYDFRRSEQFFPILAPSGGPTVVEGPEDSLPPGPANALVNRDRYEVFVRRLPDSHLLLRLARGPALLIQPEQLPPTVDLSSATHALLLRLRHVGSAEDLRQVEAYFRRFLQWEGKQGTVESASRLMGEMDRVLSKQTQCRLAFCLGISGIVGILLTALAGMEYRQNEYIYTLMKSFGIHPLLLVAAFIVENILIVGAAFAAAVAAFMYFQKVIVVQVLKLGGYSLAYGEIMPEVELIALTLLGCILLSSLPIFAAAHREIGRVLK